MKLFEMPELGVVELKFEDILTSSYEYGPDEGEGDFFD